MTSENARPTQPDAKDLNLPDKPITAICPVCSGLVGPGHSSNICLIVGNIQIDRDCSKP